MMFKTVVVLMLLLVIGSLFSGLFFLYRDRGEGSRVVKALTLRISLSILLFIGLLLTYLFGRTMLS
ncbi:MAG: twin transmembrane helix small protein [Gammaproteobacteria bacterium]|nr:twin transmembrane helix small protein [Gammaproteobacteria bacterium]